MATGPKLYGQNPLGKIYAALAAGGLLPVLQGGAQDLFVGQRVSPLYEATYLGEEFVGANSAAVTTSAALATTYVGLCLSNPAGNTKNLVLQRVTGLLEVAPAALTAIGLIVGWSAAGVVTHTTALTPLNALLHDVAAPTTAKLDSACTIVGTPAWAKWLKVTPSATGVVDFDSDIQGGLIIPPGGYVAIGTSIAGPAAGFLGSMLWAERPV